MICGSILPLIVGGRYFGPVNDSSGRELGEHPWLVLREATRTEWVAEMIANGLDAGPDYLFYYEIHAD